MAKSILVVDVGLGDYIYKLPPEKVAQIKAKFSPDVSANKVQLDGAGLKSLREFLGPHPFEFAVGGSGSTTIRTLSKLLGNVVNGAFIGAIGGSDESHKILTAFKKSGVHVLKRLYAAGVQPENAVTIMVAPPDGATLKFTYAGNIKEVISPSVLTDGFMSTLYAVHYLGTNRREERMGEAFCDKLISQRWKHGKELWLNLPTHEDYANRPETRGYFQYLISSANIVFANLEELKWTYGRTDGQKALQDLLERGLNINVLQSNGRARREPVAFITDRANGAYYVTKSEGIRRTPVFYSDEPIVSDLGCGDTANAGFTAAYLTSLKYRAGAEIAMKLARATLAQQAACLEDPRASLVGHIAGEKLLRTLRASGLAGQPTKLQRLESDLMEDIRRGIDRLRFSAPVPAPSAT